MINTAMKVLWGMITKQPVPIALSWNITPRCNLNCDYCQGPEKIDDELTLFQIKEYLNLFHQMGTRRIHFIGGEPLLRDDMGDIIATTSALGIQTSLFTNGILLPQCYDKIKNLDQISISLDGSQPIHDKYRGEGTFTKAIDGLIFLKKKKHPLRIITTLHKDNMEQIPFLLNLSHEYQVPIKFHLILSELSGRKNIKHITLNPESVRHSMRYLLAAKKKFDIINSTSSLRYLQDWPQTRYLKCPASGQFLFHINANGELYACHKTGYVREKLVLDKKKMIKAMKALKPQGCAQCWCTGTLDFNLMFMFKRDVIIEIIKQYHP